MPFPGRLYSLNAPSFYQSSYHAHVGAMGSHSYLWHPLGHLTSESGVQQGDPLGPLLVLHKMIAAINADEDCLHLILQVLFG